MTADIEVTATAEEAARVAAEIAVGGLGASLALSGGRGPERMHQLMAASGVDWSNIDVFQVDERVVPHDDERSNWRMITRTLLDPAGVPQERRHPLPLDHAASYEYELPERLDVCVLGLGPDGHVASLFPQSPQLGAPGLVTSGPAALEPCVDRITLTFRAINAAHLCLFLVTAAEKAEAVARTFAEEGSVEATPARGVQPYDGRLVWVLDEAAASLLEAPA